MENYDELLEFNLVRENFYDFAQYYNFIHNIVIDEPTYAKVSNIDGLFYDGINYIVYSTDDNYEIYYEKEFSKCIDAFKELALRNGYKYLDESREVKCYLRKINN